MKEKLLMILAMLMLSVMLVTNSAQAASGETVDILDSGVQITLPEGAYPEKLAKYAVYCIDWASEIHFNKTNYEELSERLYTFNLLSVYDNVKTLQYNGIIMVVARQRSTSSRDYFHCYFNIGDRSYYLLYLNDESNAMQKFDAMLRTLQVVKPPCENLNVSVTPGVAPTCTESGLTEGRVCNDCGLVLDLQVVVPATGHTEVIEPAVEASCTESGLTESKHCSVCGEVLAAQTVIPALGHSPVQIPAKDATCTEPGLSAGEKCERCGLVFVEQQETAPALGHAWDDGVIATEPTYKEEGSCTMTCTRCHENKTEVLPVLPTPTPFPQVSFGYGEYVQVKDSDVYIQLPKGAEHWDDTCYVPYADMGMYIVFEQFERNATLAAVEDYYEGDDYVTLHPMTVKGIRVIVAEEEFNARVYFESNGDVYLIGQEILYDADARKLFFRVIGTMKRGVAPTPTPVPTATPLPPPADMRYTVYDDYVEITRYTGSATTLEIPAYIEGKPVKVIGEQAFYSLASRLTSITIPDGVTTIGKSTFLDCRYLTSINIPDSVTSIGVGAFEGCTKLSSIDIPASVTSIGAWAFTGCESLTRIDIPASVTKVGDNAFTYCSNLERIYFWRNNTFGISTTSIPSDTTIYCYRASKVGAVFTQYGNTVVYLDGTATPTPKPTSAITSTPVPTATPTPTPSPTPTNPPVRLPGDANEDGEVDIYDALVILRYAAGQKVTICLYNADVNDDDQADILDAILILQQGAGWNVELL